MMNRNALIVAALLMTSVPAPAQRVWKVTSPTGIAAAIKAASPGDTLVLVPTGSNFYFEPFTLDKGLTIRGSGARVGYQPQFSKFLLQVKVPPGQVAHLENLDLTRSYSPFGSLGTPVIVTGGTVRFEQCKMAFGNGPSLSVTNANVTVAGSTITAYGSISSGAGIIANSSTLALRDCTVRGANAVCHPNGCSVVQSPAAPAIILAGSKLHVERTSVLGGGHSTSRFKGDGAPAVTTTGSSAWLADCTLTGGSSSNGSGAPALVNSGTVPVAMRQTRLIPGNGARGSSGPIDPKAPLLRLALAPAWKRGAVSTLTLAGDANTPYALWFTPAAAMSVVPQAVEPVWILGAVLITSGRLDANGNARLQFSVPNLASLEHATVWVQAASGSTFPLRASTIAGGVIR